MGKKRSNKTATNASSSGSHASITLRDESKGKRRTNVNPKSMLKLEHLRNLAVWASSEASIPSLGAFYGHRLAAFRDALGYPPDPTLFPCLRCETILQPGYNCTVQIEKTTAKAKRRRKKTGTPPQNYVVYRCHYCSYRKLKSGTPRGNMKRICPPKPNSSKKQEASNTSPNPVNLEGGGKDSAEVKPMDDEIASPAKIKDDPVTDSPATLSVKTGLTLLEVKRRKRTRSGSKKAVEPLSSFAPTEADESVSTSNKRKRKSWTTLKEIAESSDRINSRNITNLTVPFFM